MSSPSPERAPTSTDRSVVWRWDGEVFSNTKEQPNPLTVNLRFPGQYFDRETNYIYNWKWYYDPTIGRYLQSDPIGLAGGLNTYEYAGASPTMYYNPLGLADIFFGIEIDLTGITGAEFSLGIVIDTDSPLESGLFVSKGIGFGANVGAGVTAGYAECDIEGVSAGFDVNFKNGSIFVGEGVDGGLYGGVSVGLGLGAFSNVTNTSTFSFQNYINWALNNNE